MVPAATSPVPASSDEALALGVAAGEHALFERLMRAHNGRLFRVARAILRDDGEAEDALQDAYLEAYRHIGSFRGQSSISTWLVRIVINQALMRARRQKRERVVVSMDEHRTERGSEPDAPTEALRRAEIRRLLERRIDQLPAAFRTVFVMREVEDMTVEETAACLGIPASTVRTRLFRARALLRESLARDLDLASGDVFAFAGARCDRIVRTVLERVARRVPNETLHDPARPWPR
jgi:RNA polymerase sigma-70 factor (ECF subfamily)